MTPLDNSPDPVWIHPDDNGGTSDLRGPRGYDTGYVVRDEGTARVGRLTVALDTDELARRRALAEQVERLADRDRTGRVLKMRLIKRVGDNRIVKCEVFDADTREVVGQIFVSDVTLKYEANGSHPEALVRLISAWEDAYE